MLGLTCRVGAHISRYAHDTRLYPMFRPMSSHLGKQAEECVCVSEWIQVNMIDIATSFGAADATFWKTNFKLNHADRCGPVHAFR